jgi:acetyl-CoA C-acetyltransferase
MTTSPLPADRTPVIVGVGEITDRPREIVDGLEPLALLVEALKRAEADSGVALLREIDSLDVVNFLSWRYRDPEKQLSSRLGIKPGHAYYGPVGGESPIRYLHEAAQKRRAAQVGPNAPGSRCHGHRSPTMSRSPSAVQRSRSRWR